MRGRNKDIERITVKLDMKIDLWEPRLTISEQPERLFTVDDSEVNNPQIKLYRKDNILQNSERKLAFHKNKVASKDYNKRVFHLCLVEGKSREVPHPRAEKGGGEEEVGRAKTLGCQSMSATANVFLF